MNIIYKFLVLWTIIGGCIGMILGNKLIDEYTSEKTYISIILLGPIIWLITFIIGSVILICKSIYKLFGGFL